MKHCHLVYDRSFITNNQINVNDPRNISLAFAFCIVKYQIYRQNIFELHNFRERKFSNFSTDFEYD